MAVPIESRAPIAAGFPLTMVTSGKVDGKFICDLCHNLLKTPLQSFCGHRFCKACVEAHLGQKQFIACPSCQKEEAENEYSVLKMDQLFPDNAIKRDFTAIKVKCLNEGCNWTGNLKTYEDHEAKCEFQRKICPRCQESILINTVERHNLNECSEREWFCEFCQTTMPYKNMQEHQSLCPYFPIDCQYCQLKSIPRGQLYDHYQTSCTGEVTMCPIKGCPEVLLKESLAEHKEHHAVGHIDLINRSLIDVNQQLEIQSGGAAARSNANTEIERLEQVVLKLQHEVEVMHITPRPSRTEQNQGTVGGFQSAMVRGELSSDVERRLQVQDTKITTFDSIATVLNSEILKCLNKIEELSKRMTEDTRQMVGLTNRIQELETSGRHKDEEIAKLQSEIEQSAETFYDGQFTWKIDGVARKRQEAISGRSTSIYSPAFYSSRTGYKMCARLYLNGDGMGRGSHISLYFVILKGKYDALQKWPFKQKVTLMLLDQNRREHVVDAFRPDPSSSSFKQPVSDMNIASGCPLFCPLTTLDNMDNKAYIKNDTSFIRVVVDTTDI